MRHPPEQIHNMAIVKNWGWVKNKQQLIPNDNVLDRGKDVSIGLAIGDTVDIALKFLP